MFCLKQKQDITVEKGILKNVKVIVHTVKRTDLENDTIKTLGVYYEKKMYKVRKTFMQQQNVLFNFYKKLMFL